MQIVTVQFNYPERSNYSLLLDVFRYSCKLHMPKVKFNEIRIDAPEINTKRDLNFMYNGVKLKIWVEFLEHSDDNIIFADCDMMAIKSAEHAFKKPFDVAFTARTRTTRIPMNGGIMMARPTEAARRFFREMLYINNKMFKDIKFHSQWRIKYAGMNQSAFGYVYEKGKHGAAVHEYKTLEWNAVDCDWPKLSPGTVFVHYKSKLRKMVLRERKHAREYKHVIDLWYKMKKRMEGK